MDIQIASPFHVLCAVYKAVNASEQGQMKTRKDGFHILPLHAHVCTYAYNIIDRLVIHSKSLELKIPPRVFF